MTYDHDMIQLHCSSSLYPWRKRYEGETGNMKVLSMEPFFSKRLENQNELGGLHNSS